MGFFGDLVSVLGGSVALVAAGAWLTKQLTEHWLSRDLEEYKTSLLGELESHKSDLNREVVTAVEAAKFEFEKELILRRGEVDIFRDELRNWNETEEQRKARLRAQIQRWANPILGAIRDLEYRLSNILDKEGYLALRKETSSLPKQWSADYTYFMASTLYYFAQYFCWTRMLQHQMSFELFSSDSEMDEFQRNIESVGNEISRFPYEPLSTSGQELEAADKQVFRLQQRAIGEILFIRSDTGEQQILSYRDFLDRWLNPDDLRFRRHLEPLENFLKDITPRSGLCWKRLTGMRDGLQQFEKTCSQILRPPKEL